MYQKKLRRNNFDLLLIGEGEKGPMFLSNTLIDSCIMIHYIAEENMSAVIVYMLSLQKKFQSITLKIDLNLVVKRTI